MEILLPVDESEASLQAVRYVVTRAARASLQPLLLNVQRMPAQAWPQRGIDPSVLERALYEQGEAQLRAAEAALAEAGIQAERLVRIGPPADTILEVAQARRVGAIVMGTRGKGMLGGFALGSVALRVATGANCPVMLLKPEARIPTETPLRVVAPIDGSEASQAALRHLAALAPQLGPMHVHVVHYLPPLTFIEAVLPPHDDILQNWTGEAVAIAMDAATQVLDEAGIAHETHSFTADPGEGIANFAHDLNADLIAMAMHGGGNLRRLAFGSVTWKTVQLSRVPVLLMR